MLNVTTQANYMLEPVSSEGRATIVYLDNFVGELYLDGLVVKDYTGYYNDYAKENLVDQSLASSFIGM